MFAKLIDPKDPATRRIVLENLHERLDKHLAQAENARSLFNALNDEIFENRIAAVPLIGRLGLNNPAYIDPSLWKAFRQLLNEMEYSTTAYARSARFFLLGYLKS